MSAEILERVAHTHEAVRGICVEGYRYAETLAMDGRPVHLVVKEWEDDKTIKQRGFYHGVVLTCIAEQARVTVDGITNRYVVRTWKEFFRTLFVPDLWEMVEVPGQKRKKRRKVRVSTEDLGIRAYADLITKVMAYATTELGVRFPDGRWEDWRPQ
jgi:hypothetical protein